MLNQILNRERPLIPSFSMNDDSADLDPGNVIGPTGETEAADMVEKTLNEDEVRPLREALRRRRQG